MIGAYMAFALAPLVGATCSAADSSPAGGGRGAGGARWATCWSGPSSAYLYQREHLQQVLMTYGPILVFEELRSLIVGDDVHGVKAPALLAGTIRPGRHR
jgi:branched-chain amino acid transport system permease protein